MARELLDTAMRRPGWKSARAGLGAREDAVLRYVLSQFPVLGRAPSRQEILETVRLRSLDEVQGILDRLAALDLIDLDPESREIRSAYPFSAEATNHLVTFHEWAEAKAVYALCAVDALGLPFMFGRDVSITSSCAHCGKPIALEVRNRAVAIRTPAETVVWRGSRTANGESVARTFCPTVNFFCSPAHAAAWQQSQLGASGLVLNLGEALYLGKGIFEDYLNAKVPEKAATKATSAGGLVAAFLASVCCIGPLVFAALGVGVGATGFLAGMAGVLKALLPYRPLFIGLTAVCLGAGFYLAYRKPSAVEAACEACVPASGFRRGRLLLWIVAGLAAALVLAPYWLQMVTGS
jgi:mercuric ion transport protein